MEKKERSKAKITPTESVQKNKEKNETMDLVPKMKEKSEPLESLPRKKEKSQQMESLPRKKENFKAKKPTSVEANKQPMPISSTASTNLVVQQQQNDEEQEDIWICPVCSVAYVENGPDMVQNFIVLPLPVILKFFRLDVTLVTAGIIG
jgi:hypothetical protein